MVVKGACCHGNSGKSALSIICREVGCFGNSKLTPPKCWQCQSECWRQLWPCEMVFKGACCHGNPGIWALSIICREVGCFENAKLTPPTCCQCQSEYWRQVWPCGMVFKGACCHGNAARGALSIICREVGCFGNSKQTLPTSCQCQNECWRQVWPCAMVFKGACCHGNAGKSPLSIICREVGCFQISKLTPATCYQCQSESWRQVWPCEMVFKGACRLARGSLRSRPKSGILPNFKTNTTGVLAVPK